MVNSIIAYNDNSPVPLNLPDHTEQLPDETLLRIFSFVDAKDLGNLTSVNRRFQILGSDSYLWKDLFYRSFGQYPSQASKETFTNVEGNLRRRQYLCDRFNSIYGLRDCQVKDGKLFITSDAYPIKTIDLKTSEVEFPLPSSEMGYHHYFAIQVVGHTVFLGSYDEKVDIFDLNQLKFTQTFQHSSPSRLFRTSDNPFCLQICNGKLFTGSCQSGEIKMWDIKSGDCLKSFAHGATKVQNQATSNFSLAVNDQWLFSASDVEYGLIKKWNIASGECLQTFPHGSPVDIIKLTGKYIITGSDRDYFDHATIKIWDIETGDCFKTLEFDSSYRLASNSMRVAGQKLLIGSRDGSIDIYDLENEHDIKGCASFYNMVSGQKITHLDFIDEKLLVNGSTVLEFNMSDVEMDQIYFQRLGKIALGFRSANRKDWSKSLKAFSILPEKYQRRVYYQLYLNKSPAYFYYDTDRAEWAFYDKLGFKSTASEKATAIDDAISYYLL